MQRDVLASLFERGIYFAKVCMANAKIVKLPPCDCVVMKPYTNLLGVIGCGLTLVQEPEKVKHFQPRFPVS